MVDNAAMKTVKCPACGGKTKRNGKTKAGAQRWRCTSCGASTTQRYSNKASMLALFLDWLLSKRTQAQMGMPARTFRSLTSEFWSLWPTAPLCGEIHRVVHVDGIWLKRSCVILIACTEGHVVGWHLARSESSQAWAALMARIAPPDVVVADGGGGFERARRAVWPETRVQRCTFHAFEQVKRCTTTRPRTQAGVDLYAMAKGLLKVGTPDAAAEWLAGYAKWCSDYEGPLEKREVVDGRPRYKHERLRKARRGLTKLCREGALFTYLDEGLNAGGAVPATNNHIEGGVNRQIRAMLNEHRGMRLDRMVKAAFWYCNSRLGAPAPPARALAEFPTDEAIAELRRAAAEGNARDEAVERWGTAVNWSDLHSGGPYRSDWD